jgi:uncharacterized protein YcnI
MSRSSRLCASATVAVIAVATPTFAHVTLWPQQSRAGATERYTVRVPTERPVSTTAVDLEIPAGVNVTGVLAPAGFTYDVKRDGSRIVSITWKQEIKAGEIGEFVFFARNPTGAAITWKAHQHYADGQTDDWIGPPGDRRPAPVVKLTS